MENVCEGGCLCGAVRYRVRGKPVVSVVCHCKFCQRRLGSAFATFAYFDETNVEFIQGHVTEYEHRSDESGRWLRMQFCSKVRYDGHPHDPGADRAESPCRWNAG